VDALLQERKGVVFDSLLFVRPDMAALVPALPLCAYRNALYKHNATDGVSRHVGDWIAWLPRGHVDAAFGAVSAADRAPSRHILFIDSVHSAHSTPIQRHAQCNGTCTQCAVLRDGTADSAACRQC
jgi:hypothetical protein